MPPCGFSAQVSSVGCRKTPLRPTLLPWQVYRQGGWIAGTTFLVLLVPLIIEMDREQQQMEFETQQVAALTGK